MWAPGSASPRPAPGRAGARGKGSAKFRQRRASPTACGRAPPRPAAASSERGDPGAGAGRTQPAAAFRRLPELLLPGRGSCGWRGPVAPSRGRELLCACSPRQRGCVCVCRGGVPGQHRRLYLFPAVTSSSYSWCLLRNM